MFHCKRNKTITKWYKDIIQLLFGRFDTVLDKF